MANIPGSANDRIFAEKVARSPKCARCRNHGFVVQLKGHSGKCQFRECLCWKCSLINERTRILASQRRMKSAHGNESSAADQSEPRAPSGKKPLSVGNNSATNGENGGNDKKENTRKSEDTGVETYIELQAHHTTCAVNGQLKTPAEPIAPSGAVGDSSPFPGEYIIKETFPGQMYPAEMLAMPLPLYPDRYMIPAVLVSLRPPAPGAFREHVGLVPLPARALPHPLESQEWQIHVPHYNPFPPYEYSHHSQFYMDEGQRGSDIPAASVAEHQVCGNQGTEDVHIESLSSRNVC